LHSRCLHGEHGHVRAFEPFVLSPWLAPQQYKNVHHALFELGCGHARQWQCSVGAPQRQPPLRACPPWCAPSPGLDPAMVLTCTLSTARAQAIQVASNHTIGVASTAGLHAWHACTQRFRQWAKDAKVQHTQNVFTTHSINRLQKGQFAELKTKAWNGRVITAWLEQECLALIKSRERRITRTRGSGMIAHHIHASCLPAPLLPPVPAGKAIKPPTRPPLPHRCHHTLTLRGHELRPSGLQGRCF